MSSVVLCSTRMDGLQLQLPNLPDQTHCPIVNDSLHACNQRVFECLPNFARTFPLIFRGWLYFATLSRESILLLR